MRFPQTACKFEGLHFSHRFFHDLMYHLVAMSVNIVEKKKNCEKDLETLTLELHLEALKITSPTNGGPDLVKRSSN